MAQQNTESWGKTISTWSVVGTFNKLVVILLRFTFGKQRIENNIDKLNLFKSVLYGFVSIALIVMVLNLYPLFLRSSEVLNFDWQVDGLKMKIVSHCLASFLMFLLLSALLLTNSLFHYSFEGEGVKKNKDGVNRIKLVVRCSSVFFSIFLAALNKVAKALIGGSYDMTQINSSGSFIFNKIDFMGCIS